MTPSGSSTAVRPRGAARREALLRATLRVIARVGADAVTHRAVAAEAELPLASTTYHFASKEELLAEALRYASERDVAQLRADADAALEGAVGPAEVVAALMDPSELPTEAGRTTLLAGYTLVLEAARRPALRELSRAWIGTYVEIVSELLQAAGSRRPHADARLLIGAFDGLAIDQLASGSDEDLRAELQRLATLLLADSRDRR